MSPGMQSLLAQVSDLNNHSDLDVSSSQATLPLHGDLGMFNFGEPVPCKSCWVANNVLGDGKVYENDSPSGTPSLQPQGTDACAAGDRC